MPGTDLTEADSEGSMSEEAPDTLDLSDASLLSIWRKNYGSDQADDDFGHKLNQSKQVTKSQ
jgi:hypothetical protein